MRIQLHHINPDLQPYIKLICSMDCDDDTDTRHIRVLPDACVEIFINYTNSPVAVISDKLHKRSIVSSRMSRPTDVQMRKGAGCMAVCFNPGMAYPFFRLPMHLLSDTTIAFSDVTDNLAYEIEEQLALATSNELRSTLIQNILWKKLLACDYDKKVYACLEQAEFSRGLLAASSLASGSGLSERHLSRKFQDWVGLSPKEYLQILRFKYSLNYLKMYPAISLTEVAYKSGYYDQAHFNRDYKTYTGHTPGEVLRSDRILY